MHYESNFPSGHRQSLTVMCDIYHHNSDCFRNIMFSIFNLIIIMMPNVLEQATFTGVQSPLSPTKRPADDSTSSTSTSKAAKVLYLFLAGIGRLD